MLTEIKNQLVASSSSNWPFLYSVDVQTSLIFFFTVVLSLLAPFPGTVSENDQLNFIHESIYEQLDTIQVKNIDDLI